MTIDHFAAARHLPFIEEPFITIHQLQVLKAIVQLKGWTWKQFTVFTCDKLLTVPSCMTECEANAVIDYFEKGGTL